MEFSILCDANLESGVEEVVLELSGPAYRHFGTLDYGQELRSLAVVLMCRDPAFKFKRRLRFLRKERSLEMDVMLHLPEMVPLTRRERRRVIIQRLQRDISEVLKKYRFRDFDALRFKKDMEEWFAANAA